jgi:hypothetical protein
MDKIEINPPLREDNPRIPSPWGDEIFYYPQVDLIKEAVKGKKWRWCEVRPDQIIGTYVPLLFPSIFTAETRVIGGGKGTNNANLLQVTSPP